MNKIVQSSLDLFYAVCVRIEQFCNACFSNNSIALVVIQFSQATDIIIVFNNKID